VEVNVVFAEDLAAASKKSTVPPALIIGKKSVVLSEAGKHKLDVTPIARLTGKDGSPDQFGLIVVRQESLAKTTADLKGYRILFGPEDCDEKSAAAVGLLKENGIEIPAKLEISSTCSTAAVALMALKPAVRAAGVISSYAEPLLAGCGAIKQGDLRVVGKTKPVAFITAFATKALPAKRVTEITEALLDTGGDPALLKVMESLLGFIELEETAAPATPPAAWNQFRGPNRDGSAAWLPEKLPATAKFNWQVTLPSDGVGGIAATDKAVILGARDALDGGDVFFCLDAATGAERWRFQYPAPAREPLDYGNSPRATPLIAGGRVFILGAFGHLHCLDLATGALQWVCHLPVEFAAALPHWGYSSSPLLVANKLVVQPGGAEASLVALDPATGDVIWESPGGKAAYAGLIAAEVQGVTQIIGCDDESFGGWDAATGRRLWKVIPGTMRDFHVPTPFMIGARVFLAGENNGARLHAFNEQGALIPEPAARSLDLAPDAHTPVLAGGRIIGLGEKFSCLDAATLQTLWTTVESEMGTYASMISNGQGRVLTLSEKGMLFLHEVDLSACKELGRLRLCPGSEHVIAHPAIVGNRLYVRMGERVACMEL
jgi:outer membrane protein assembly factor BamB/ABC-type phosphate/phosphonate transport system substrate-binding protein